MHVEVGQHGPKSTGLLRSSRSTWRLKVTDFFRFAVGDE
jgi:hypothetical protein